jgi:sulfate adenylyltransferase subunit 1
MPSEKELIASDIEGYLRKYQDKELLRFVAVGSVDDGKSTLIGRLLYDTGSVYADQLEAVRKATTMAGTDLDLSLVTDGLAAEREQGITIDVAYRYFSTDKRKFIIADTPGHVQYTRNMVTGASTANVAIILIDARLGVLQQSRRHAYIASLLGTAHLAVCVNKMDLVSYHRVVFDRIRADFLAFTKNLSIADVRFFPISALRGDNCVHRSEEMPWYAGPTVLEFLESVPVQEEHEFTRLRYPVQYVLRPNLDYRGFAGRVASGVVRKGDAITVLPSGKTSHVEAIDTRDGELTQGIASQSVTIRLADEIDVSRGDMLVHPSDLPRVTRTFDAHLVWMHDAPLDCKKSYLLKHTTQTVRADVDRVHWRKDMDTLAEVAAPTLALNDIGRVTLTAHRPLFLDAYETNRETGSFILIDLLSNNTVGAGMVLAQETGDAASATPASVGAGESKGSLSQASSTSVDDVAIHAAIEERVRAVRAKDVDVLMSAYATDVVAFDLVGPIATTGSSAVRKRVIEWFSSFETPIEYEVRDVSLVVSGDVAFDHHLTHVRGTGNAGQTIDMWFRETVGYRKIDGRWKVTHQHSSVPLDVAKR